MREGARAWLAPALGLAGLIAVLGVVSWILDTSSLGIRPSDGRFSFEAMAEAGLKLDEQIDGGEVWRLVSAGAVNTSLAHFAINSVGLVMVGYFFWRATAPDARQVSRAWVVPAIVVVSSTAGFFVSYLARSGASGGASAGVYGVLAAVAGVTWARRGELPERLRWTAPVALTVLSIALVAIILPSPGMDHAAHFGGWAAGLGAGYASARVLGRRVLASIAGALVVLLATRWL